MENFLSQNPLFVNWNYTDKCNFKCKHCYSRNVLHKELSTKEYLKIVEFLIESNVFQVNLGGGEPILRGDYNIIAKKLSNNGIKVNLSTNGWFIDKRIVKTIKDSGITTLFLSLDHIKPEIHDNFRNKKGSYNKVIKAIYNANKIGLKVKLSTVLTKLNFSILEELIDLAYEKKCYGIDIKRFRPEGNGLLYKKEFELSKPQEKELYEKIQNLRKTKSIQINLVYSEKPIIGIDDGCPCGKKSIAIRSNGDISPCVYNPLTIGNILKDNLSDLWVNSPILKQMRSNFSCLGLNDKFEEFHKN